jgi:branched-chain amino acid transport system permease protein/neutral amino acid transport system permease protein
MQLFVASLGFGLVTASILAIASVGFTLQFGVTNILNLAYGSLMTASAFVAYVFTHAGLGIWPTMAMCAVFGAAASTLLNRAVYAPYIRRGTRLFGMIIVTISVGLVVQYTLQAIWGAEFVSLRLPGTSSYHLGAMTFTGLQLGIMAVAVAAMAAVHTLLRYTKLGKAMRATAADPVLARSCGIATDRVIDVTWLLSGALCGLAGVVLVMNVTSFTTTAGASFLIPIVAAAILGGVGQPYGAMLGAVVIGVSSEVAAGLISPTYKDMVAFLILVVFLLIRPQGLLAEIATQKEVVV